MTRETAPIPPRYAGATPYLSIRGADAAIDFYCRAFGAEPIVRMADRAGRVMHAEISIGSAVVMLGEECIEMNFRSPASLGGSPVSILIYVEDVDALMARAVGAGAAVTRPIEDQFWGDRMGELRDPFGHLWSVATHIEDVGEAEIERRFREKLGEL